MYMQHSLRYRAPLWFSGGVTTAVRPPHTPGRQRQLFLEFQFAGSNSTPPTPGVTARAPPRAPQHSAAHATAARHTAYEMDPAEFQRRIAEAQALKDAAAAAANTTATPSTTTVAASATAASATPQQQQQQQQQQQGQPAPASAAPAGPAQGAVSSAPAAATGTGAAPAPAGAGMAAPQAAPPGLDPAQQVRALVSVGLPTVRRKLSLSRKVK